MPDLYPMKLDLIIKSTHKYNTLIKKVRNCFSSRFMIIVESLSIVIDSMNNTVMKELLGYSVYKILYFHQ